MPRGLGAAHVNSSWKQATLSSLIEGLLLILNKTCEQNLSSDELQDCCRHKVFARSFVFMRESWTPNADSRCTGISNSLEWIIFRRQVKVWEEALDHARQHFRIRKYSDLNNSQRLSEVHFKCVYVYIYMILQH